MSVPSSRNRRRLAIVAVIVAVGIVLATIVLRPVLGHTLVHVPAVIGGVLAIMFSVNYFRSIDELAQRAHYEAWYWGGTVGVLALPLAALSGPALFGPGWVERTVAQFWPAPDVTDGFVAGVFATVIPMLLGYCVWWAVFWLRKL